MKDIVLKYISWYICLLSIALVGCKGDEPQHDESVHSEIVGIWYGTFKYNNPVSGVKYNYLTLSFDNNQRGSLEYESSVSYRNAQFSYQITNGYIRCVGVCTSTEDDGVSEFSLDLRIEGDRLYPINMYTNYILTKDNSIITNSRYN